MTSPLPEDDLLALVEGDLAPERVERVRAVLLRHPELLREIEAMRRDRARLQAVEKSTRINASPWTAGLVRDAVAKAEREALLHESETRHGSGARHRRGSQANRSRRVAMLTAAALTLAVMGTWSWFVLSKVGPSSGTASSTQVAQAAEAPKLDIGGKGTTTAFVGPPSWLEPDEARLLASITPVKDEAGPETSTLVDEWMRLANADSTQKNPDLAKADHPLVQSAEPTPGLSLTEAAQLALEGKLRIVVSSEVSGPIMASAADGRVLDRGVPTPLAGPRLSATPLANFGGSRNVVFRVASGEGASASVQHELAEWAKEVEMATGAPVRFEKSQSTGPASTPSLTFEDILWWSRPTAEWRERLELRVPIEVEAPGDSPSEQADRP